MDIFGHKAAIQELTVTFAFKCVSAVRELVIRQLFSAFSNSCKAFSSSYDELIFNEASIMYLGKLNFAFNHL